MTLTETERETLLKATEDFIEKMKSSGPIKDQFLINDTLYRITKDKEGSVGLTIAPALPHRT